MVIHIFGAKHGKTEDLKGIGVVNGFKGVEYIKGVDDVII